MANITKVSFCALFIFYFIDTGYGLNCLSCYSEEVMSDCRQGKRTQRAHVEMCYGPEASCYSTAIVTEYGEARFQRGCTRWGVCKENDEDLKFCYTCQHNNCNFVSMELNQDIEDYLVEKYNNSEKFDDAKDTEYAEEDVGAEEREYDENAEDYEATEVLNS